MNPKATKAPKKSNVFSRRSAMLTAARHPAHVPAEVDDRRRRHHGDHGDHGEDGHDVDRACALATRIIEFSAEASLAQLVEHALRKRMVVGSIPTGGSLLSLTAANSCASLNEPIKTARSCGHRAPGLQRASTLWLRDAFGRRARSS